MSLWSFSTQKFTKNKLACCQFWTKECLSCHIWNQNPWICLIAKYCEIMKMPKFGTKNALFVYFWASILKNYCHIWNQHPQICLIAKFCEETKMLKFGTKNALFGYFWARILKNYCHIWNHHPQICLFVKFHEKTIKPKFGTKGLICVFLGWNLKIMLSYLK